MTDGPDLRALRHMSADPSWQRPLLCARCPFAHPVPDPPGIFYCGLLRRGLALAVDGVNPPCRGADWRDRAGMELARLLAGLADVPLLTAVARDAREESLMYNRGLAEGAAAEREACCKAVCADCDQGWPVVADPEIGWRHANGQWCRAHAIRTRANEDGR